MRHQTPRENRIENNTFNLSGLRTASYGISLGSRQGRRTYCEADAGYNFGSSADKRDLADDNVVTDNVFNPPSARAIVPRLRSGQRSRHLELRHLHGKCAPHRAKLPAWQQTAVRQRIQFSPLAHWRQLKQRKLLLQQRLGWPHALARASSF